VTHDHGVYEGVSPIDGLVAALSVRAAVISTPEPGMVVVGAGKRDLAYDLGLPSILGLDATVRSLYDHHAVVETGAVLSVGDIVEFGFSHPCSVFDRWPAYVSTLADGSNPELWRTEFGRSSVG
jgi:D-serine deaminase-like pyridoxal phosphate-dependent protein